MVLESRERRQESDEKNNTVTYIKYLVSFPPAGSHSKEKLTTFMIFHIFPFMSKGKFNQQINEYQLNYTTFLYWKISDLQASLELINVYFSYWKISDLQAHVAPLELINFVL